MFPVADVDPKSVLCAFYKAGQCGKGDKCKFSHDLEVERRTEKRNIYNDARAAGVFAVALTPDNDLLKSTKSDGQSFFRLQKTIWKTGMTRNSRM